MPTRELDGRNAIVTGGRSWIGRAIGSASLAPAPVSASWTSWSLRPQPRPVKLHR